MLKYLAKDVVDVTYAKPGDTATLLSGCEHLRADARALQETPRISDITPQAKEEWNSGLAGLAKVGTYCVDAIQKNDERTFLKSKRLLGPSTAKVQAATNAISGE